MDSSDIAVVGQGPAGMSAAIYSARAGLKTVVVGCDPKVAGNYDIDNYFGFPEGITGKELIERGKEQARKFGAELRCASVLSIEHGENRSFVVKTEEGELSTRAIILATGVSRVRPGVKNLGEYEGRGVSYCVSCDGFFYREKKVKVLGEGLYAANQALELTQYTPHVSICTQGKKPDIPSSFLDKLLDKKISVEQKKIVSLEGEGVLEKVVYEDGSREGADGLFLALGEATSLNFAYSLGVAMRGIFVETDEEQKTNVPGIFAAGDCVGRFLQISVAVGEGAVAGRAAVDYVRNEKKPTSAE